MVQHIDRSGDDLDTRAREVLREIIMQHVATGEAISSRSLAKCGRFQLSPASLRNVMADLEDLGYLQHPHTSAGRVPTDRGYRFFIDHLMRSRTLTQRERETIDDQVSHANEIDEVLHLASRVLSRLSDQVGVIFMPTLLQFTIRSMDFVARRRQQDHVHHRRAERRRREQDHRDAAAVHARRAAEDLALHHRSNSAA